MKAFSAVLLLLAGSISAESVYEKIWDSESDLVAASESSSEITTVPPMASKSKKEDKKEKKKKDEKKEDKKEKKEEKKEKKEEKKEKKEEKKEKKEEKKEKKEKASKSKKKSDDDDDDDDTTSTSTSKDRSGKCIDDDKPRVIRNGDRYRFKLQRKDAQCTDIDGRLYEYGEFKKIKNFSDCADACVEDTRSSLLDSLRGYDYDCYEGKCRCLYDRGTLDSRNSGTFNRTSRNGKGEGKVEGTTRKTDFNCAKLSGTDLGYEFGVGYAEREFDAVEPERALRGNI